MQAEALFEQNDFNCNDQSSTIFEPNCLNINKKLFIKANEQNKKIGVLKIFPKTLDPKLLSRIFEGRIQVITNITQFDIE